MSSDDAPHGKGLGESLGESFDERARTLNSDLQRLIEAVGTVLSASGELLGRLQRLLGAAPSEAALPDPPHETEAPPPSGRSED